MSDGQMMSAAQQGQTLQKMETSYATAVSVQVPRSLVEVNRRLKEEALIGGESFYYGWGAGKNHIEGPSIQLATSAARAWGNCAVEMEDVQDMPDSWVFTAIFVDIETGFTLKRQFRQSKTSIVHGKHDQYRKEDIRFQIGQSKAARNVIINALPNSIIKEAMETAKSGVRDRLEKWIKNKSKDGKDGMVIAQDGAIDKLKKCGIEESLILEKFGRTARGGLTIDDLIVIKGDMIAIDDGSERAEELYSSKDAEPSTDSLMEHLAGEETPEEEKEQPAPLKPDPGASKRDSKGKKGGTPTDAPPGNQNEPQELTEKQMERNIHEIEGGSLGETAKEAALELRSRFSRLGEEPDAFAKRSVDYENIEKIDGPIAVNMIGRIEAYYLRQIEAGKGDAGKTG